MKSVHEGYKMTELGEIPVEWEMENLGESCEIIMGQSPKGESYNTEGHGTPLLNGPTEFGAKHPKEVQWTTSPTKFCMEKDILFCVRGSSIGRMNIADKKYCIGRGLAAIRQAENETVTQFISFVLQNAINKVLKNSSGSTFPNITKDELYDVKLPIPSILEQQKIAEILSNIDEQLENTDLLITKTKELKKGLMQQLLTKGIGHTEFKKTELGEIPVGWEIATIKQHIIEFRGGASISPNDFTEAGAKVIPKKGVQKGGLLVIENDSQKFVSELFKEKNIKSYINNQYLVTVLRDLVPTAPSIGLIVKIKDDNDYLLSQGVYGLKINKSLNENFLIQYSNSDSFRKLMKTLKVGSTQVHLRNEDFLNVKIPYPSIEEQQKIAEILSTVDEQIESYEQEKEKYTELKKGLMQQLLTGKIRVKI